MDRVDLWHARLAMKTLRRDQRAAIAAAAEEGWEGAEAEADRGLDVKALG